jgi:hypothetical protein
MEVSPPGSTWRRRVFLTAVWVLGLKALPVDLLGRNLSHSPLETSRHSFTLAAIISLMGLAIGAGGRAVAQLRAQDLPAAG